MTHSCVGRWAIFCSLTALPISAAEPPAASPKSPEILIVEQSGSGKTREQLILGTAARLTVDDEAVIKVMVNCAPSCSTQQRWEVAVQAELPSAKGKKVELFKGVLSEADLQSYPPTMDLHRLGIEDGATLDFRIAEDGTDGAPVHAREATAYVRKSGFDVKYSDTFLFVRSALQRRWSLAEGAQATVGWHFDGSNGIERAWNTLDPHVGIALTLLDFQDDKSTEYGLGAATTFLSGTVVIGYGWNISAEVRSTQYGFFGFSIVKLGDLLKKKTSG